MDETNRIHACVRHAGVCMRTRDFHVARGCAETSIAPKARPQTRDCLVNSRRDAREGISPSLEPHPLKSDRSGSHHRNKCRCWSSALARTARDISYYN